MRVANRVLAVAVALALLGGGLLIAAEIAWGLLGQEPLLIPYDDWYASARVDHWEASGPRTLFVTLAVAGLAILALQGMRARPRSVALESRSVQAGVSRRALEAAVVRRVENEDGVVGARARIDRRRARVVAVTRRTEGDLGPRVEEATRSFLQSAGVSDRLDVAARVERQRT